ARIGDLAASDQLVRRLAELGVRLAQLTLRLDVFDALLRLRRSLLGRLLRLVEKTHRVSLLYSRIDPRRPPMLLSSLPPPAAASTRRAVRENGSVCSVTCPGPVMWTRNKPSPPNKLFATPPCSFTSYFTVGSIITMQPVSMIKGWPGARSKSRKSPPACSHTVPLPFKRCRTNPSPPPWRPMPSFRANALS